MGSLILGGLILLAAFIALLARELKRKNMFIWLGSYFARRRPASPAGAVHVVFCFVDHFEPRWGNADHETEIRRVREWRERYSRLALQHRDGDGVPPRHTFFFPEEEYRPEHIDELAALCREGCGEIEVHLHHDNDTSAGFRQKMSAFIEVLHERHGALPIDPHRGTPAFGFIHGNWCLDNSRADGRWCGVNDELQILHELGCYADFTLPSAPSDTQTQKVNSIYWATDDPLRPKSHNSGVDLKAGHPGSGDLLIVQGPLSLNWHSRKWGILPRIESGDVRASNPPTPERVDLWVREHIHIAGRPEWVFVKVHTHGTQEQDMETLLGEPMGAMFDYLESAYNDGKKHVLHYVSSREMFNIIRAAEDGLSGNPGAFRDYVLPPPRMLLTGHGGK
jgi:hypothetical protein